MTDFHHTISLWCDLGFFPNSRGIKAAAKQFTKVNLFGPSRNDFLNRFSELKNAKKSELTCTDVTHP